MVDASWALANRGDGTFDRWQLFGATLPQYVTWELGTVVGVFAGDLIGDLERLGLDAIYPTFFLGPALAELRDPQSRTAALAGAGDRAGAGAVHPAGVPILAAAAAALSALGLGTPMTTCGG